MAKRKTSKKKITLSAGGILIAVLVALALLLSELGVITLPFELFGEKSYAPGDFSLDEIPDYSGYPHIKLNNGNPYFDPTEYSAEAFEEYAEQDSLGRCTYAFACVGLETMPAEDEERDNLTIEPSGWQSVKYDTELVSGSYLYNRCHLIGHQLTAENNNKENLITGTRYLNITGMLDFENMVAAYIKETENHVLYRVTPIYSGTELVARGVIMEAYSVEDNGEGICFNVYVYNVQPGIEIDYSDGSSKIAD